MSNLNRLFGLAKSSGSARKSGANNARLRLESLEAREVPAVLAGGDTLPVQFPYQVSVRHEAADSVPTDQLALNFAKIEFNAAPVIGSLTVPESRPEPIIALEYLLISQVNTAAASDYLLELDGVKGESRAAGWHRDQIHIESFSWGSSSPGSSATPVADDVIVDGRIITGENYDSAGIAPHGYIRIKKLNSGG